MPDWDETRKIVTKITECYKRTITHLKKENETLKERLQQYEQEDKAL